MMMMMMMMMILASVSHLVLVKRMQCSDVELMYILISPVWLYK